MGLHIKNNKSDFKSLNIKMMTDFSENVHSLDLSTVKEECLEIKQEMEPCKEYHDAIEMRELKCDVFEASPNSNVVRMSVKAEREDIMSNIKQRIFADTLINPITCNSKEATPRKTYFNRHKKEIVLKNTVQSLKSVDPLDINIKREAESKTREDSNKKTAERTLELVDRGSYMREVIESEANITNIDSSVIKQERIEINQGEVCHELLPSAREMSSDTCDVLEVEHTEIKLEVEECHGLTSARGTCPVRRDILEVDVDTNVGMALKAEEPVLQEKAGVALKVVANAETKDTAVSSTSDGAPKEDSGLHVEDHIRDRARPHACSHCRARFTHIRSLNVHLKKHTDVTEIPVICVSETATPRRTYFNKRKKVIISENTTQTLNSVDPLDINVKCEKESETCEVNNEKIGQTTLEPVCKGDLREMTESKAVIKDVDISFIRRDCTEIIHSADVCDKLLPNTREMSSPMSDVLEMDVENDIEKPKPEEPFCQKKMGATQQMDVDDGTTYTDASRTEGSVLEDDSELHNGSHNEEKEKPCTCSHCGTRFTHISDFNIHMKKHTVEGLHHCPRCNYKCVAKHMLRRHMISHTSKKPHACSHCGDRFTRKDNLNLHIKKHTGKGLFQCSQCDYKTIYKTGLKIHIKKHTGEGVLQCAHCNYRTIYRNSFITHIKKHSSEDRLHCAHCNYKTIHKSCLNMHLKKHTEKNVLHCPHCSFKSINKFLFNFHVKKHTCEVLLRCQKIFVT